MRRGSFEQGEKDLHSSARTHSTVDENRAAQLLHVLVAFVGPDSHARLLRRLKRFEEAFAYELGRHAAAGVSDLDHRPIVLAAQLDPDATVLSCCFDCVLYEMADDALDAIFMTPRDKRLLELELGHRL